MSDIVMSQDFPQLHIVEVGPTITDQYSSNTKLGEDVLLEIFNDSFGIILLCSDNFYPF